MKEHGSTESARAPARQSLAKVTAEGLKTLCSKASPHDLLSKHKCSRDLHRLLPIAADVRHAVNNISGLGSGS